MKHFSLTILIAIIFTTTLSGCVTEETVYHNPVTIAEVASYCTLQQDCPDELIVSMTFDRPVPILCSKESVDSTEVCYRGNYAAYICEKTKVLAEDYRGWQQTFFMDTEKGNCAVIIFQSPP